MTMKLDDVKIAELKGAYEDAAAKGQAKKLYNQYMSFQLKSFEAREEQYITDLAIAYDLGQIYFQFKKFDDAIIRFQKTVRDPQRRTVSTLRLGQCFGQKGQHDLAIRQLSDGIDGLEVMSDRKKELLYTRGTMYEAKGQLDQAKQDYLTIYEVDIAYKDVSKKVES